ncbi:hypothetical protein CEUSTIGMA_g3957.t1 [Chlamydomonas eustigma]|uniref:Ribosome-binding factor A n=1 Tax=Chlamydomonas eustigma TaxID=1157962 RepID=A0A250X0B6_9CHLO|nr:hypothetical protein CEUSTIGMA_g3957.t1 [Chlamydomonas eustigma]|eukprot:GAX76511.1 hypothetical protein CEUSTIGMA_g3957.t1 [Chlamydomonas eustigma]
MLKRLCLNALHILSLDQSLVLKRELHLGGSLWNPIKVDYYRHPQNPSPPSGSIGQRRLQGHIERSITNIINFHAVIKERLVEPYGFVLHKVSLSLNRQTVSILWDCHPATSSRCSEELKRMEPKIRAELASQNLLKKVPNLVFQRDMLKASEATAAALLDRLEVEMEQGVAEGNRNHTPSRESVAVDAAILALRHKMRPLPTYDDNESGIQGLEEETRTTSN